MIKKLVATTVTLIIGVIVIIVYGNGWCFIGEFSKDSAQAKIVRIQNEALRDATKKVESVAEQVSNAQSRFNKTNILIETTEERKTEADSAYADYQRQAQFFKDHIESNEPIRYTDGSQLTEDQIDLEVDRIGMRMEASKEASQAYSAELVELRKVSKIYEEFAIAGPSRVEALQLKLRNMRQLFDVQNKRLQMLNDGEGADLKKAYKEALASINEAKAGLGLGGKVEEREINYDDNTFDEITEKSKARLRKIDAWLGKSEEVKEAQVSFN